MALPRQIAIATSIKLRAPTKLLLSSRQPRRPSRQEGPPPRRPGCSSGELLADGPAAASRGASTTSSRASVRHELSASGATMSCPAHGSGATPYRLTRGPGARGRIRHQQQIASTESSKKARLQGQESFSLGSNHITTHRRRRFTTEKDTTAATGTAATTTGAASSAGSRHRRPRGGGASQFSPSKEDLVEDPDESAQLQACTFSALHTCGRSRP